MHLSVIAPSFKISEEDLSKTLDLLKSIGHDYSLRSPIFEAPHLCAASTSKRFEDLKHFLSDNKTNVIWCLRGGYGALHLLPSLLKLKPPQALKISDQQGQLLLKGDFKLLIGFSDITILHYFLNQQWNWPTLHYRHLNSFVKNKTVSAGVKEFHKTCKNLNQLREQTFTGLRPLNTRASQVKNIKGKIVGGNLITLQSLIGLALPTPKGKILFLEEIDEPIYKIDRALTQLEQAGWLKGVKAIILGSFTHQNPETQKNIQKFLKKELQHISVPVFGFLPCGHIEKQRPLFFNTPSELVLSSTSKTDSKKHKSSEIRTASLSSKSFILKNKTLGF